MAITQTQIVDYLNKKVGYGVAKTDTSTAKYPFNESIASPLLTPGQYVWQQDYYISTVTSAPTSNTVINGSTIVAVYNTSTSAVVQASSLSESIANETWSTGITNWIPPSFGSGYQLKLYAGPSGASAATAATYTNLPVAGSGNNDSWFFDYQAGIVNFADTNVPTAVAGNVVYVMGAVYTGTTGITNYANLNVTGNLTSTNGNIVLTNGNITAQNYYGTFLGTIGGGVTLALANVSVYNEVTAWTTNQTFYPTFSNISATGNTLTGVNSSLTYNPSTGTLSATTFSGSGASLTNLPATNIVGTVATANVAYYVNTTSTSTNANYDVFFGTNTSGNLAVDANSGFTFNPSTGNVTATAFVGSGIYLTGVAGSGTGNVSFYSNISNFTNNQSYYLTFANLVSGNSQIGAVSSVSVNPSTGTISATTFSGSGASLTNLPATNIVGTVATANVALYDQIINLTNNQSYYITFANVIAGNSTLGAGGSLTWNPSTQTLVAPGSVQTSSITAAAGTVNVFNSTATTVNIGGAATTIALGAATVAVSVGSGTGNITVGNLNATNIYGTHFGSGANLTNLQATNIVGTVATANVAIYEQVTALSNNQSYYPMFANISASGNTTAGVNSSLSYNPSTGTLSATTFSGTVAATNIAGTVATANVALYDQITNLTNNQTYYLEFANVTSGNSSIGAVSTVNVNPSTSTIGAVNFNGTTFAGNALTLSGADNNGSVYTSGALQISGGAGISGNLYVQGNVYAGNIISTQSQIVSVLDPLLYLNANTPNNYNYEIGFYSHFGAYGVSYQHTGLARDHNAGIWKLFANTPEPSGGTINFTNSTWEALQIGSAIVANTTAATGNGSGTAGALYVAGGAGVAGAFYAGSVYDSGNRVVSTSSGAGNLTISGTGINLNTTGPGAFTFGDATHVAQITTDAYGRVSSASNVLISVNGSNITGTVPTANASIYTGITNTTTGTYYPILSSQTATGNVLAAVPNTGLSFNVATGALSTGILATTGTITAGGNIVAQSGTGSTSTTTGALVVNGGAGITGNAYIGAAMIATGGTVSTGAFAGSYSDGIILDYVTGLGRISVGPNDGLTIYNGGLANTALLQISTAGVLTATGNVIAPSFQGAIGNATPNTGAFTTLSASGASTLNTITGASFQGIIGNITPTTAFFTTANATTVYAATIGNVGTTLNGTLVATSVSGTVATANVAISTQLASSSVNASFYPAFYNLTAGNAAPFTNSSLTFNPSTGTLSATNFSGTFLGTISTANVAYYVNTTAVSTNASYDVFFGSSTSGNLAVDANSGLTYNPSTGILTTTTFNGNVTGSVTGTATTANAAIYTGVTNTSAGTYYPLLSGQSTTGNTQASASSSLSYNAATGTLTATIFSGSGASLTNVPATSIAGTVATANVAYYENVIAVSSNQSYYPTFSTISTNGNTTINVNSSLSYNPSTGALSATSFNGVGTFSTATTSGTFIASGNIVAASGTTSTSPTTGALVVNGGAGISGNLIIGTALTYTPANAPVRVGYNINNYSQFTIQNANSGNNASTDIAAVANNGSDTDTYIDMGILSSTYSQAAYSIYYPNDGYLIVSGNTTTGGGNLVLTTTNANDIVFATYGQNANNEVMRITSGNVVKIKSTVVSSGTGSGALQVSGGAGIVGTVYASSFQGIVGNIAPTTAFFTTANATNVYAATVGNVGTTLVGTLAATNVAGTVATANISVYDQVVALSNNQNYYPMFSNISTTGNTITGVNSSLYYNPSTGTLFATNFMGTVQGTISTANVTVYEQVTATSTNASYYPMLSSQSTTGNIQAAVNSSLSYNPSTGALSATTFNGAGTGLTGTASSLSVNYASTAGSAGSATTAGSATSATYATQASSVSINSTTSSTTYYPLFTDNSAGGVLNEYVDGNGYLKYTPSTGTLTASNLALTWGANVNTGQNSGRGADLYVSGKNDKTLLWAHAGTYDSVIIGNSATTANTVNGAKLVINSSDSIMLPVGSNANRPSASGLGTDTAGMLRYSTTQNAIEWYNGTSWASASTSFTVIADQQITPNGSTNTFALTNVGTTAGTIVSINGVVQIPTLAYSIFSGNSNIVFTEIPLSTDIIDIRTLTTTATVTGLSTGSGKSQVTVDDSAGIGFISGGGGPTQVFTMPIGGGLVSNDANISVASSGTPTTIDTVSTTTYRSAKYVVQVTNGTNFQTMEALMVQNGTTAFINTYGVVSTAGNLGILSATVSSGNVLVQFTAANSTNNVRTFREYIPL